MLLSWLCLFGVCDNLRPPANSQAPCNIEFAATDFSVDFVYCWAGEGQQTTTGSLNADDHDTGGGWNEIWYSLRSIEKNAAWANKIYILVNGEDPLPKFVVEGSKIRMVDRCSLFPDDQKDACPTYNVDACQAVSHLIPGLSDHYIYIEDDNMIKQSTTVIDFFTKEGKPRVRTDIADRLFPIYPDPLPEGPDRPPPHIPEAALAYPQHVPMPTTVTFQTRLQKEYPDWFAFVRSHTRRFSCCDAFWSPPPGIEEDFTRMVPGMLLKLDVGKLSPMGEYVCDCNPHNLCLDRALWSDTSHITTVINNCDSARAAADAFYRLHAAFGDATGELLKVGSEPQVRDPTRTISFSVANFVFNLAVVALMAWCIKFLHGRPPKYANVDRRKVALVCAFVATQGLQLFMPRLFLSRTGHRDGFSIFCASALVCLLTMLVAVAVYFLRCGMPRGERCRLAGEALTRRVSGYWTLPAFLFPAVPSILLSVCFAAPFASLGNFDASAYEALTNLKVIFVAFFWQLVFRKHLPRAKWVAVSLFALGSILMGFDMVGQVVAPNGRILCLIFGHWWLVSLGLVLMDKMCRNDLLPVDLLIAVAAFWGFMGSVMMDICTSSDNPLAITCVHLLVSNRVRYSLFSDGFLKWSMIYSSAYFFTLVYFTKAFSSIATLMVGSIVIFLRIVVQWSTGLLGFGSALLGVTVQGAMAATAGLAGALLYFAAADLPWRELAEDGTPDPDPGEEMQVRPAANTLERSASATDFSSS